MRILLDTHTLIWHQADSDRLSAKAAKILDERTNILYISMATLWEMAIKRSQGKLSIERTPLELLKIYQRRGAKLLQISTVHVMAIESLPLHHRDPFDRMLIAQAKTEGMPLVTVDEAFREYGVRTVW